MKTNEVYTELYTGLEIRVLAAYGEKIALYIALDVQDLRYRIEINGDFSEKLGRCILRDSYGFVTLQEARKKFIEVISKFN